MLLCVYTVIWELAVNKIAYELNQMLIYFSYKHTIVLHTFSMHYFTIITIVIGKQSTFSGFG